MTLKSSNDSKKLQVHINPVSNIHFEINIFCYKYIMFFLKSLIKNFFFNLDPINNN